MGKRKKIRAFIATNMLFFALLIVGSWMQKERTHGFDWADKVNVTAVGKEGCLACVQGTELLEVDKGEEVWLDVSLPKQERMDEGVLCFIVYNYVVDALFEDEVIYQKGHELHKHNLMIGQSLVQIAIPREAWGKHIKIHLLACEKNTFARPDNIRMYSAKDAYLYISGNNIIEFISSVIGMCGGVMSLILLLIFGSREEKKGIFVAAGTFALALWEFTVYGQYHVFSESYFWVLAEYIALLLCPALILTHISVSLDKDGKLCRSIVMINWIWCICALVLHFTGIWHLSGSVSVTRGSIIIACVLGPVRVLRNRKSATESEKMRNSAIVLLSFWGIVDLINFYLGQKFGKGLWGRDATFSSMGLILFIVCMVVYLVLVTQEVFEQKVRKEIEHQRDIEYLQKSQAYDRLKLSINQLHPHFLYNVLCSIQVIIKENADYAYDLLYDFMAYLRGNIDMLQSEEPVEFQRELENIEAYMNIEKMRYPERKLFLKYDIQCRDFKIAPLSIEMLVENAAKYGRFPDEGGEIRVSTAEDAEDYIVEVSDNGGGFDLSRLEEEGHTGIRNVKLRLEILVKAQISIESVIGKGTRFVIKIPK